MSMLHGVMRSLLAGRREALAAVVTYLLNAPFTASDQGFADGQVLNTVAEGITDGQLTVVEVDGTLAIVSNECAFTTQASPQWGDLGYYSAAITKALGRTLLVSTTINDVTKLSVANAWKESADVDVSSGGGNRYYVRIAGDDVLVAWGTSATALGLTVADATEYQLATVLGGYDSNEVPWRSGQAAASYLYGCAYYIKGGAFTGWTLVWRTAQRNTSPLYAVFAGYQAVGTLDDFRVPDSDLSAVLQPTCLSTFDAANGTSLDAISPEVGGTWTERIGDWDIQGNRARCPLVAYATATVQASVSDVMLDAVVQCNTAARWAGHVLRYSDSNNWWGVHVYSAATNLVRIIEYNGGGQTVRASAAVTITTGVDYDVRAIAYGQTIDGFVDGGNKISYGSAALNESATIHGIQNYADANAEWDNWACYPRTAAIFDSTLDAV